MALQLLNDCYGNEQEWNICKHMLRCLSGKKHRAASSVGKCSKKRRTKITWN